MKDCSFCKEPTHWAEILTDGRILCAACRPCRFFERHLTLTGDYAGQKFELMPWVREVLRTIYGTLDDDGTRQYRDIYLEIPTGNSKTSLCAGITLYELCTSQTSGTEIYSAASSKDQAAIVFNYARQMVQGSKELTRALKVLPSTKRILMRADPTSFYAAISADGDVHDGINPSFVVRDELHRWRTRKALGLNEVLERKMVKRKNPMVIDITTAGEEDESPLCVRRHEYAQRIKEGLFHDRRFYGRIWAADPKRIESDPDYWKSREARVMANPSHEDNGGYIKDSSLEDACIKATNDPKLRMDYLRFTLNYWGVTDLAIIDMPQWIASGGQDDLREWPEYDVDYLIRKWGLIERTCYAGVDASWSTDLSSLVFVFPPDETCEQWVLLPFFWMAEEQIVKRQNRDKVPYDDWARRGFLTMTPGVAVDLSVFKERIRWGAEMFDLREVDYDPWGFKQTAKELADEGLPAIEVRQNFGMLSEPTKKLLTIYQSGEVRHGNHPVMNFCARSLSLKTDGGDNVRPSKLDRNKNSKRIDGISASITAMARAIVMEQNQIVYTGLQSIG